MRVIVVQSGNKLSGNWTTELTGEILKTDDDKKMGSAEIFRSDGNM
jgi:hypothetical protein